MIKSVDQMTVSDIYSINSDKVYRIPKYQREYTWGKREWDAFFNDVMDNESGYFFGSYICVNNGSIKGTVLEVIDGQQRLTTLTILFSVLYNKLFALKDSMDEEEQNDLANLRRMLTNKKTSKSAYGERKTEFTQRLKLQKQNSNDEDYLYMLSTNGIITEKRHKPSNYGNRRIAKAYRYFVKLIDEKIEEEKNSNSEFDEILFLFSVSDKFRNSILVGIEVDSNKDAYMLFESLNHRGIPLSALDLIKNTLISHAGDETEAENSYEIWKQILINIGQDDYSAQERFFRQYYNAFRDEINEPYITAERKYYFGYLATKTTLIDIYEKMIKANCPLMLNDLLTKSEHYSVLINRSENTYLYTDSMKNLERISGAPSYILLLYLLAFKETLNLSDENIDEVVKWLITFFVRRSITDVPNTRKLTQLFIDIISQIRDLSGNAIVLLIHDKLKEVSAADTVFEEKLRGSLYDENPEATRFVLCSIEKLHQTREIYSDLWEKDKNNKFKWTIEHIFPEGENIPDSWVEMIADGDRNLANQYREAYVHTIGNLTITGYNQNLSNFSFEKKRDRKSKDNSAYIGYKNGLYLNETVVNKSEWTIDSIKKRTGLYVDMLLDIYRW